PVDAEINAREADNSHQQSGKHPNQDASGEIANPSRKQPGKQQVKAEGAQGMAAGKAVTGRLRNEVSHGAGAVKDIFQNDIEEKSAPHGDRQPQGCVSPVGEEKSNNEGHE